MSFDRIIDHETQNQILPVRSFSKRNGIMINAFLIILAFGGTYAVAGLIPFVLTLRASNPGMAYVGSAEHYR